MDLLNIYHICEGSTALGPGYRYVIWVQGCMQNCKGCITPQSRPFEIKHLIKVGDIADSIIHNEKIEGITISGGEPFLQSTNLARLLSIIGEYRPELTVIVFTGYTLKQLTTNIAHNLLQHIDLLIDGQYVDSLNDEKGLRGSSNQKLYFLTNRLLPYKNELENGDRNNEIIVGTEGTHIIGIPRRDIQLKLINF